jgi:hypothetical protein
MRPIELPLGSIEVLCKIPGAAINAHERLSPEADINIFAFVRAHTLVDFEWHLASPSGQVQSIHFLEVQMPISIVVKGNDYEIDLFVNNVINDKVLCDCACGGRITAASSVICGSDDVSLHCL